MKRVGAWDAGTRPPLAGLQGSVHGAGARPVWTPRPPPPMQASSDRDAWKARCDKAQAMLARVGELLAGRDASEAAG